MSRTIWGGLLALVMVPPVALAQPAYETALRQHRDSYRAAFLKEPDGPLRTRREVARLRFYNPDSTFRVVAEVQRTTGAEPFDMLTYNGQKQPYVAYAVLRFTLSGEPQQLTVYRSLRLAQLPQYRDYLFVPFKDATNGTETYGGGRYLDVRVSDIQNNTLRLDFNKAYNPYCAYREGYACPVPPKENHLKSPIRAGEKNYK